MTQIELVQTVLEGAAGAAMTADEVAAHPSLAGVDRRNVAAALSELRARREVTGIVRPSTGHYAFRPDSPGDDAGDLAVGRKRATGEPSNAAKGSVNRETLRQALKGTGRAMRAKELVPMTGLSVRQINQALPAMASREPNIERVSAGLYRWNPTMANEPGRGDDLEHLASLVPDDLFPKIGLNVVAHTQEGHRVALDENGVAWVVSVKIESKLL